MSCRPRGPSDRPLHCYYDELELGGSGAPRLPGQSIASRLLFVGIVVCCCGIVALALLFAVSLALNLQHGGLSAAAMGPGAALVTIEQRGQPMPPPPARRTQRSMLARMATLKRATLPETGADRGSLKLTFPRWFDGAGDISAAAALGDVALALSYLAQEDAHNRS